MLQSFRFKHTVTVAGLTSEQTAFTMEITLFSGNDYIFINLPLLNTFSK